MISSRWSDCWYPATCFSHFALSFPLLVSLSSSLSIKIDIHSCLTWSKRLIFIVYYHLHTKWLASHHITSDFLYFYYSRALSLSLSLFHFCLLICRCLRVSCHHLQISHLTRKMKMNWLHCWMRADWSIFLSIDRIHFKILCILVANVLAQLEFHHLHFYVSILCYHRLKKNKSYRLL